MNRGCRSWVALMGHLQTGSEKALKVNQIRLSFFPLNPLFPFNGHNHCHQHEQPVWSMCNTFTLISIIMNRFSSSFCVFSFVWDLNKWLHGSTNEYDVDDDDGGGGGDGGDVSHEYRHRPGDERHDNKRRGEGKREKPSLTGHRWSPTLIRSDPHPADPKCRLSFTLVSTSYIMSVPLYSRLNPKTK